MNEQSSAQQASTSTSSDRAQQRDRTQLRPEPTEQLDPRALPVWRIGAALSSLVYWVSAAIAIILLWFLELPAELGYPTLLYAIPVVIALAFTVLQVGVLPTVQWNRWRYAVHEHEIDLKRGVIITTRTLIPMSRVQHVDSQQGPLLRYYQLATVTIATAAGTHEIPALALDVADDLRDRISRLAEVADDV